MSQLRTAKIVAPLFAVSLLAGAIHTAVADEEKLSSTFFEVTASVQTELVGASGSAAEARGKDNWYITDSWGNGVNNNENWSAVFLHGEHRFDNGVRVFARHGFNYDMDGLKDGRAKYRDSYVGVAGSLGMVRAGRLESPYKLNTLQWDPFVATFLQARTNMGAAGGPLGAGAYIDDAVDYTLVRNGVTYRAFYSNNDGQPAPQGVERDSTFSGSINFPIHENIELAIAHIDAGNRGAGKRQGTKFGARTRYDQFTFAVEYEFRDEGLENGEFLFLSGTYNDGQRNWSASYGQFMDDGIQNNDGEYYALGVAQRFNRNVAVHAGYRRTERDITGGENTVGIGLRLTRGYRHTL